MIVRCCVKQIIFRNEENGYTVFLAEYLDSEKEISVVGNMPPISIGQNIEIEGEIVVNKWNQNQLHADRITFINPDSIEGIYRYLCSGLIKGVGPITAQNIVNHFGKETLNIIEYTPDRLIEVNGISTVKANQIIKSYNSVRVMQNTILYLQKFDITTNTAMKIYKFYGDKTKEILSKNPYVLVEDINGIGFVSADRIAQKMGVLPDSEFRFRAGILHVLNESVEKSGNTYIKYDTCITELKKLLDVADVSAEKEKEVDEIIENVIFKLTIDDKVKIIQFNNVKGIILSKLYYTERSIAVKITQLNEANNLPITDIESDIKTYELINKIKLHEKQKEAVSMAVNNNICIITGGPGTGKTTIIKCVINILKGQGKKVLLLAPTGRAAKKINESTGEEAKTIHRALEIGFNEEGGRFFTYDENNPLSQDVIIVDEVSMIDCFLMNILLKALKRSAQLILVGDKDQLPSVGAGNVLSDILKSGRVKTCTLTEIYRQDNDSYIITNAHAINKGNMPTLNNRQSKDFFFEQKEDTKEICKTIIALQSKRLPKYCNIDPKKIQVLAPMKNGDCGIDNLNIELQKEINPKSFDKKEIAFDRFIYRVGDKVMQIENDYEQEWTKFNDGLNDKGKGVFNGDMGIIEDIDPNAGEILIAFDDGRKSLYNRNNLDELTLSYAITIHKSQGSEFDIVIIPAILGAKTILTRNLLYTAVTRAKKMVVIVGTKRAISMMVLNNYTQERLTTLRHFLEATEQY